MLEGKKNVRYEKTREKWGNSLETRGAPYGLVNLTLLARKPRARAREESRREKERKTEYAASVQRRKRPRPSAAVRIVV